MASLKEAVDPNTEPEDVETILSQRQALKYFKVGISSSLAYELFAFIPMLSLPEKNVSFVLKYVILKLADFVAL